MNHHRAAFVPSGRGVAKCPPDPKYPNGIDVVMASEGPACRVQLPYPAPECGMFVVECELCPRKVAITAAGRPDDPKTVTMPCGVKFD